MRIGAVDWRTGDRYSEVELPDGRVIPAVPHDDADYTARAARLGYPDGAAMNREHDAVHAALAHVFGTTSPVLRHVADMIGAPPSGLPDRRRPPGVELHWQEEELVLMVQHRLNDPGRDEEPGGGFVSHLRGLLRASEIGSGPASAENGPT